MKACLLLALTLISLSSFAETVAVKPFAGCYGDHHGNYVEFKTDKLGAYIETSNDGEDTEVRYNITKMTKNFNAVLKKEAYSWAIRQAIKSSAADNSYGQITINAESADGDKILLNLNKYTAGQNYLVKSDMVEELTCPLDSINE